MIKFKDVIVLVEGYHKMIDGILPISSTVTLIKTDKNIVIDCGGFKEKENIVKALKDQGLTPEDIDIVFLTHLHLDHLVNVTLFKNAKIYCKFISGDYPGQCHDPKIGALQRINLQTGNQIAKDVETIELPGHSNDMCGLIINTDKGKIIVAGDAMPSEKNADINVRPPNMVLYNSDKFDESRKKVLNLADFIIPGHGNMFENQRN